MTEAANEGKQPSHMAILNKLSAGFARMDAKFEGIEQRMDSSDVMRGEMLERIHKIDTRTTVLETQGIAAAKGEPPLVPTPRTKLEQWGMWAGLIVGLPTIATVLQALWSAIGHFIKGIAE